jgi:hypothetical protein
MAASNSGGRTAARRIIPALGRSGHAHGVRTFWSPVGRRAFSLWEVHMNRRSGSCRQILGPVVIATALATLAAAPSGAAQGPPEPQVLYWERNGQPGTGTAVGLLYTSEVLTALASRMPAASVPPAIARAIHERAAIVAMWEFPPSRDYQRQLPYHMAIVEQHSPLAASEGSIQPLWIQQEAGDLARVDVRLTSPGMRVGAIAAFPASAFVPGRLVLVHSTPEVQEDGMRRLSQRWGVIRWDGTAIGGGPHLR